MSCYDSIHCILAYYGCRDKKNNIPYCNKFLVTNNGGKTWECASIDCSAWIYDSSYNNYKYYNAYLVRQEPNFYYSLFYDYNKNELISSFDSGKISRSYNYGKTWVSEKDTIFDTFKIDGLVLVFLDGNKAIGYNNNQAKGYARLFISGPDYKNWKNISIPDSIITGNIFSIFNFQDKFYLLNDNIIDKKFHFCFSKTTDNGKNWASFKLQLDSGRIHTSSMFFLNDSIGWIIGNYTKNGKSNISVFYTSDGGDSWNIISDFFSDIIHKYLFFYNKDEGVMLSSNMGFITNDGGKTWEKLTYHNNEAFPYPIKMLVSTRKNEFLCITNDGIIFKLIITN
jgi:hypothetical protein